MATTQARLGMIGLGVMGRNLLLNMADHGFDVVGYDRDPSKLDALRDEAEARSARPVADVDALVAALAPPRVVMMLVPAGKAVDAVIDELLPRLERGDIIIDGGNSHFTETNRRAEKVTDAGVAFVGMGVSGGEEGARHGPSMMPGGPAEAYERVRPVFEAIAARAGAGDGDPCVAYLGPGSAGHYVKMVHNGIEYGLMQLIAESYDLMHRGFGMDDDALADVYERWSSGDTGGFLIEITARIFRQPDDRGPGRLVDAILDVARQKGTGMWTSQDALSLGAPVPTIDVAVAIRHLSALSDERAAAATAFGKLGPGLSGDRDAAVAALHDALYAAMAITYAQGMALLAKASASYAYELDLEAVSRIWRGGCIIRAALLEELRAAYRRDAALKNPLLDPMLGKRVSERVGALRKSVTTAAELGIPAPALMASLAYFDAYRSARLPANLTQAQRDLFGAHTYERYDRSGVFHTHWK